MNLAVPIENFDLNIVYYLEPIRNTVIDMENTAFPNKKRKCTTVFRYLL